MKHAWKTHVGVALLSLALLTSLAGCLQTAQTPQVSQSPQVGSQGETHLANHAIRPYDNRLFSSPSLSWGTSADGKGFYTPQIRFLNYYDPEVGIQVPLCSQSGCYHTDQSCEAYLAERVTGFADYNGTWYVLSVENSTSAALWKVEPKSHQRTKVFELTSQEQGESYYFSSGFLSHGYAYLDVYHDIISPDGDNTYSNSFLRVQLDTGEAQTLFEDQYINLLGAGEDRVLIAVSTSTSTPLSQEEYLEQNPGGDYYDYLEDFYTTHNPAKEEMELREYTADLSSYQVLASGYIRGNMVPALANWGDLTLYAVENELYLYNLATGESRLVEYPGTLINFLFIDGRIVLLTHDPGLKVYYADVEGGPAQLLKDEGDRESVTFASHGENKDYIYGIYSEGEGSGTCIVSKEDYWAQRFDNTIPVS